MNTENKLSKLFDKLERYNPENPGREDIINKVMNSVSERSRVTFADLLWGFLFGWTENLWVRGSLVAVSFVLVFVFALQQFSIVSRIDQLEDRMVESNTEQIIRQQGEYVLINSVLMQELGETNLRDSITVADKDLKQLIDSYSELAKRYRELKHEYYQQRFNVNTNKQEL